jgi:drug/metabolite transporter (DMT)-like permease
MNPLFIILFRIAQGDRLRKPTPEEERRWAGLFCLIGIYFGVAFISIRYARHFWDTAGEFSLVAVAAVVVVILTFVPRFWGRYVPAVVSWIFGAVLWVSLFVLALTGHLA